MLDVCNYCGQLYVPKHKHNPHMCRTCGNLYERFRKARRRGNQTELRTVRAKILARRGESPMVDYYMMIEQTEVIMETKVCKQCGRDLPIEEFRKYTSRGLGIYNTTQGRNTICRDCESISGRAARALTNNDTETIELLRSHYKQLQSRGLPPVTAPAKRLLGVDVTPRRRESSDLMQLLQTISDVSSDELQTHIRMLEQRSYESIDEAWSRQRALEQRLREANLWERASDLYDEWDYEEA